jgi:hemoglobin
MDETTPAAPLYERLGGRPRLQHLLRYFYADVRQHQVIGPIFHAHIRDWPAHLDRIADFWSGVTGGPATYTGAMPARHVSLGLEERHFSAWLDLWQRHCRAHLPPREAEELIGLTHGIARRLRQILGVAPAGENLPTA